MKEDSSYSRIWRWHFYAGVFVAPFLTILAVTGLCMMMLAYTNGRDGEQIKVAVQANPQPISAQADAAVASIPNGTIKQYIAPRADDRVAVFRVDGAERAMMVAVDPYTAEVVKVYPRRDGLYQKMEAFHGTLFLGKFGDYLIETAASLAILMIATGWYLWWKRQRRLRQVFMPKLGKKSGWWRRLHGATGSWISLILLFFLISGLSWAGIWGERMVQAWSQFPAGKFGNPPMPVSAPTHGDVLNDGLTKEVPWVLELTPMPTSDTSNTSAKAAVSKNLDTLDQFAREQGFEGRYQINFPHGEIGVWTLSQDSMSYDSNNPMADRTMHLDQYSGEILADIRFQDYNLFGKFMAAGVALHMGNLGWWSVLANALFCLAVVFMCVSGFVMWWKRRPSKAVGLAPPPARNSTVSWGLAAPLLALAVIFPTAMLVIVAVFCLDYVLFSRIKPVGALVK
ncbi:PepSY-associated TM helix domain-containing protein [Suttonella sp. R2A3]|uniref:PepSY-associated TM helix domain-containing protein n=1 Tax=Suttonella sp. R2A3 TaxID=2908648 RepID=UPI0038FCCB37